MVEGLHDVVEVGGGCVGNLLGLPVGESVDEAGRVSAVLRWWLGGLGCDLQQLDASSDDRVGGSVSVFVPAVGCANHGFWEQLLDLVDLLEELLSGEVAAIE